MQFNRTFIKGVAVLVAAAACSDGAVPPVAPTAGAPPSLAGAGRRPDTDEQVTVTRTIDVQPPAGPGHDAPSPVRWTKTFTFGARTVTGPQGDAELNSALKTRSRPKITSAEDLPVVGLTYPARSTSLRGAVVPWRRVSAVPDDLAMTVESFGTGDAPPTMIRMLRNGVVTMTITQEWELWQRQWNLVRRESTMPDGYRELVIVSRTGRSGVPLQALSLWAREFSRGETAAPSFDMFDDDGGGVTCPGCQALSNAERAALVKFGSRSGLALLVCALTPPPAQTLACFAATAAATDAFVDYERARADLSDCLADPIRCPPPKPPESDSCSKHAFEGRELNPRYSCTSSSGSGTGGETDGGGSASSGSHMCTYYYEFDMDTGYVLYSELLYCT